MGHCEICGKDTKDSAVIYQADLVGVKKSTDQSQNIFVTTKTNTTVKTYANVVKTTLYCCKECRKQPGFWVAMLIMTVISAGLLALFIWGGPWNGHNGLLAIICALGAIVFGFLTPAGFIYTLVKLIHPYDSVESQLITYLNKPDNNKGHKWLTSEEGNSLKPVH